MINAFLAKFRLDKMKLARDEATLHVKFYVDDSVSSNTNNHLFNAQVSSAETGNDMHSNGSNGMFGSPLKPF